LDSIQPRFCLSRAIGVEIAPGNIVVLADVGRGERAHIHHTRMPVALTAYALVSSSLARGRFPGVRFVDLVTKLISTDADECHALAALGGWNIPDRHPGLFLEHLYDVIEKHHLHEFFGVYPERPAMFRNDVRPHGIDWTTEEVDKSEMAAWQKAYKESSVTQQMLVASILWLYHGRDDTLWMKGLSRSWHAADAISAWLWPACFGIGCARQLSILAGDRRPGRLPRRESSGLGETARSIGTNGEAAVVRLRTSQDHLAFAAFRPQADTTLSFTAVNSETIRSRVTIQSARYSAACTSHLIGFEISGRPRTYMVARGHALRHWSHC